ncbi:MAG TPA: hypothetical protein VEW65_11830 [Chryseolinea sp.]|nr:hypothetical protein [Chryseolinea sp.]
MNRKKVTVEEVRPDLDIDEHIQMQERGWNYQRVGLYCILIFVVTAAAGLYGNGLASKKTLSEGGTSIEFEQFFRHEAKMQLKISTNSDKKVSLSFPAEYLSHFEIEAIVPDPAESFFEGGDVRYIFPGDDSTTITFYLVPQDVGNVKGAVKVDEHVYTINHLIFP